jgi:phosphopantothenoylcysteine decarboxylase/phosphopantothenate--cysteine ligase
MLLQDRQVLLGVTGGIAAYKSCELARMLVREGAVVQAVLTPNAAQFVTPLTFTALTGLPTPVSEFPEMNSEPSGDVYQHLSLSEDIDCYVIAPATANTLAKLAYGLTGNLVCGAYLSCEAPVVIAPAMNRRMWQHPATQASVGMLRDRGNIVIEPATGELACGDTGAGRLAELPDIFAAVVYACDGSGHRFEAGRDSLLADLAGKHIIVTAGGTREYLDPVRFLTNASTGQLGLQVASELARRGAVVTLIDTGVDVDPAVESQLSHRAIVSSASDMQTELERRLPTADGLIMLAAVADYSAANPGTAKHKKDGKPWAVDLVETPDILAGVAAGRMPGQLLVGVSLEDTDWLDRGMKKTAAKGVDLSIAVELGSERPFGEHRIRCALVEPNKVVVHPELRNKAEVSQLVADWLAAKFAGSESIED